MMMKKLLAMLLTMLMVMQCMPVTAGADSSLRPEIDQYGSVEAAMNAYASRMLRPYKSQMTSMTREDMLAFRATVDEVYFRESHDDEPSKFMEALVTLGFTVTENDNRWLVTENQIKLDLKYLMLLAQMEAMPFEDAVEQVQSYMPEYNLGAAAFGVASDVFVNLLGGKLADMMKKDAAVFAPSIALASKTMSKGGVASRTLFKAMDGIVDNYDRIFSGANALTDSAKALGVYTAQDESLNNLVNAYNQVISGRALVDTLLSTGMTDEEMTQACSILNDCYEAYYEDLNTLSNQGNLNQYLRSKTYLTDRFNELIQQELSNYSYLGDVSTAALAGAAALFDIWNGGWGTIILKGGTNVVGEALYGTTSTYTHFHAMATLDEIYAALAADATINYASTWEDYVAYARTIQRLCNVALLGETHVYELAAVDVGAAQKLANMLAYNFAGRDVLAEYGEWYKQRVEYLQSVYNSAEEYIAALYEHYDRLCLQVADVTPLLGYENNLTSTITGVVLEDEWYALPDGSGPDKEKPNPNAGKPVQDLPIQLVANGEVIAHGSTDGSGRYSITYPLYMAQDADLYLNMGDETIREYIPNTGVSTINYPDVSFRSSFRFNADTESVTELSPAEASFELPYADDYFLASSYEYNHNLALASLGLAAASMSAPDADGAWTQDGSVGRDRNIRAAWGAIGYSVVRSSGYDASLNEITDAPAYTIASRTFTDPDARNGEPEQYRVVGVAIRGDVDAAELAHSLMAAGAGSSYQGSTRSAALDILAELESYILSVADEKVPLRVWITGFSRGGAVAGQLCDLIKLRSSLNSKISGLYAYTFGATASSNDSYSVSTNSSGVFNIVYEEDLVATGLLPALQSGYHRPAHTFTFGHEDANGIAQNKIASAFSVLTHGNTSYDPAAYVAGSETLDFLAQIDEASASGIYTEKLQPLVAAMMQLSFLRDDAGSDFRTLSLADKHQQVLSMLGYSQTVSGPIEFDGSFLPQFTVEGYRANLLEGMQETFFAALPEDMQNNLNNYLDDILQLAARQTGANQFDLDEDVQSMLLSLAITLSDDFSNPTCLASSLYGHHPEIYMAWMMGMSGGELFSQKEPDVFNTLIMPVEMNLMGTVLEEGTDKPIAGVLVTATSASGEVQTIHTEADGTWCMFVKPDNITVTFKLPGYEDAKETVSKAEFSLGVVERLTYMKPLPVGAVVVTTDSYLVEGDRYVTTIVKPTVWSEVNPDLTAAMDKLINPIFEEAMKDAASMAKNAGSCRTHTRSHTTHAYMSHAYATDGMVQLVVQEGYFICTVGHNVNNSYSFAFDIASGKRLTLDDLYDPANPNAKTEFLAVMDELIDQTAGISASASKVYNRVKKHDACTWYFLNDGIYMTFDALNTGWFDDLLIPYESLKGILRPEYLPSELLGFGVISPIASPAPETDEGYAIYLNTPENDTAFCLDGLVSHLWVNDMAASGEINSRARYFYAYKLKDAKVWLHEGDEAIYLRWQDSQGYYTRTLTVNDQE